MVGDGRDEGTRRRLPSWMAGSRKSSNSYNGDESGPAKTASASLVVESEPKRRRARISSSGRQVSETVKEKKRVPRKKKVEGKSVEFESDGDGEEDLTVDDLVTIAKEYVEAAKDFESEKQKLAATPSENELRSSNNVPESFQKLPSHRTTDFCDSAMNLTSEQGFLSSRGTGDPAKDMLDLFLGPLLKNAAEEENKTDFTTTSERFSYELRQMSQNDLGEEMVPRKKTKSSLKDKVAMFLD